MNETQYNEVLALAAQLFEVLSQSEASSPAVVAGAIGAVYGEAVRQHIQRSGLSAANAFMDPSFQYFQERFRSGGSETPLSKPQDNQ